VSHAASLLSLLAACAAAAGCADESARGAPAAAAPGAAAAAGGAAPQGPPPGAWLLGDLHVHTTHSHDAATLGDDVEGVIRCAERAGLDFISITDHRTVACLHDPDFQGAQTPLVLLAGEEWGGHGHAGIHGLTRAPVHHSQDSGQGAAQAIAKVQATIDDAHAMGGAFILNHPVDTSNPWCWPAERFDGIEVWNQQWALRNTPDLDAAAIARWMADNGMTPGSGPQPMPEVLAAVAEKGGGINWQRLKFYEAHLSAGRRAAAVGGGDTHYFALPGSPTTAVYARDRSAAAVIEGIRAGRTMVLRAPDAPRLELTADRDGDGVFESMIGDSIPRAGAPLTFKVRVRDCERGMIDLVRDGRIIQRWAVTAPDFEVTYSDAPSGRSWYRVDCWEPLDMSVPYAQELKRLTLGTAGSSLGVGASIVAALGAGGVLARYLGYVQDFVDAGGPAALWLLLFGDRMGVRLSPASTRYPRLEFPEAVSRILNVAIHQDDYCAGAFTSPIRVE
jgi:hypothetical protein